MVDSIMVTLAQLWERYICNFFVEQYLYQQIFSKQLEQEETPKSLFVSLNKL